MRTLQEQFCQRPAPLILRRPPHPPADAGPSLSPLKRGEGIQIAPSPRLRGEGWGEGQVSVVVPTLNAAGLLPATLAALRGAASVREVIVADGGSSDETAAHARAAGARVVEREVEIAGSALALRCGEEGTYRIFPPGFRAAIGMQEEEPVARCGGGTGGELAAAPARCGDDLRPRGTGVGGGLVR